MKTSHETFKLTNSLPSLIVDSLELRNNTFREAGIHKTNKAEKKSIEIKANYDPNTIGYNELIDRGFSKRVAYNILKYRKNGGIFNQPTDLLHIYGIDTVLFFSQLQYISINREHSKQKTSGTTINLSHKYAIELNTADSTDLMALDGIGIVLSKRIIKYRNLLGGFNSVDQVKEIYGITDSLFLRISLRLTADTGLIQKIAVNHCTLKELERHPYLDVYTAKSILNYRRLAGPIDSIQQLIINQILTHKSSKRIIPYFDFN